MTRIHTITGWIEAARSAPLRPWLDYTFEAIPFAVYDPDSVAYVNHPAPPADRPPTLMAATATDIGGIKTATLPAFMCTTEDVTIPLAYHEGFHVYQAALFVPSPVDMFTAMAYYPELDPEYRALCRVEAAILADAALSPQDKLPLVAHVIRRRREHLSAHESLVTYERFLERNEGTASFVEQFVRLALYGVAPEPSTPEYGWAHFYKAGAALCWLLDAASPGWQSRVEAGESPGDIALSMFPEAADLSAYDWEDAIQAERDASDSLRTELRSICAPLEAPDALAIRYPANTQVFRAFAPNTMQGLGDGRILHRTMFKLILPDVGQIAADAVAAIDDVAGRRVLLPARTVEFAGNLLTISGEGVEVSLRNVTRDADGAYRIVI